jgi:tetratricopeptide (TPR) repeat protein
MTEPLRTAPGTDGSADADRDALIERLLLAGLDHYFEGRYEEAVNVWTRVAFLERGHGRARAYIERARGALAERQRESDELLHRGLDAYQTGDLPGARDLLTRAVANGSSETALVFLERLGIAEAGHAAAASGSLAGHAAPLFGRTPQRRHSDRSPNVASTNWIATILVSILVASAILLAAQPIASWLGDGPAVSPIASPRARDPLPVVRAAEMRLARAKALYASGKPYDALRLLEAIDRGDPFRGDADTLTAAIQTALLAGGPANTATLQTAGEAVR